MKRKVSEKSLANLKSWDKLTPEERAINLEKRKRTINSPEYKEKQAKKKNMAEILNKILSSKVSSEQLESMGLSPENIQTIGAILGKDVTLNDSMLIGAVAKAIKEQDITAMSFIRDTIGEKAPEKVESSVSIEDYVANHKPKL